ncbi:MAG: DUF402 domain-containing protein [Anaerolineales bacterium]|nr:DUF402 domain-containing protein [Anaerolineales bacterium]
MNEPITVHKLNERGEEVWRYSGNVLHRSATSVTLEARFDGEDVEFFGLFLRYGDRFVETFYKDRWYNVFRIYDVDDGRLKGWYCNITRPAQIKDNHVFADDLALDLVVRPDGQSQVLDADEFAALELSPEERNHAMSALEQLISLAATHAGPFGEPNEWRADHRKSLTD